MAVAQGEQAGWDREGEPSRKERACGKKEKGGLLVKGALLRGAARGRVSSAAIRCQAARRILAPAAAVLTLVRLLPGPLSKRTPACRAWPPLWEAAEGVAWPLVCPLSQMGGGEPWFCCRSLSPQDGAKRECQT